MKTNFLHTIFFNTHTKWYFKLLAWLVTAVLAFMVFYIVGCQDLSFVAQNRVDCEAGPVECNEEQGLMVSPTEDEENMDCGSGDTEGDGCFDVGGGMNPATEIAQVVVAVVVVMTMMRTLLLVQESLG